MASDRDIDLVITGASGYVGGYIVRSAASRGYKTRGLVRGPVPWLEPDQQRVVPALSQADAAIENADTVVHLAAPNETAFRTDPKAALLQTVEATRDVARACARNGVRRLVYVSTVHVYGSALQPGNTITEETPAVPNGEYGQSRLLSEQVARDEAVGVQVVLLRLTNGVGPPASPQVARWTLVANDLCRQAAETGRMQLAQPAQWRDFIPLPAVASVILGASDPGRHELIGPGLYNLSAGRSITILDLARLIAAEAGHMRIPVSIDAPDTPVESPYLIDNTKIRNTGLLAQDLSLSQSIRDTLQLCVVAAQHVRASTKLGS